jgi:hypothetical protein
MAGNSLIARLQGKLIAGIAIGGLVYVLVVVYSGWRELEEALRGFPWLLFPLLLALAFANYLLRFLKWHYYLGQLKIPLAIGDSLVIFLAGLIMTISPGKIGELLKCVLLKQRNGTLLTVSAPIIVAERITDFLSLLLICVAGLLVFTVSDSSLTILGLVTALLVAFILAISNRRLCLGVIALLERWKPLARIGQPPGAPDAADGRHVLVAVRLAVRMPGLLDRDPRFHPRPVGARRVFHLRAGHDRRRRQPGRPGPDRGQHAGHVAVRGADGRGATDQSPGGGGDAHHPPGDVVVRGVRRRGRAAVVPEALRRCGERTRSGIEKVRFTAPISH